MPLKLKLNGKRLCHKKSVKNLDMKIDENLNWKKESSDIAIMLNKANGILSKLRHFMDRRILKSMYHAIFQSH